MNTHCSAFLFLVFLSFSLTLKSMNENSVCLFNKQEAGYKEQRNRIARYFVKHAPDMPLNEARKKFMHLDDFTQQLILEGNVISKQSPFILLPVVPEDIFIHLVTHIIPRYENKQNVTLVSSQYCTYVNGYPEYRPTFLANFTQPPTTALQVSTQSVTERIKTMPVVEALSLLSRFQGQKTLRTRDIVEDPSNIENSLKMCGFNYDDQKLKKEYYWTLEDLININYAQQTLLENIAKGHTKGLYDFNKRYCITPEDKKLLLPLKEMINNNQLLKMLQICIPYTPSAFTIFTDKVLLGIPLWMTSHILPTVLYAFISGKLPWYAGALGSYGCGYLTGEYGYPLFHEGNFSTRELNKWFTKSNRTKVKRGWGFAALSLMHYCLLSTAGKCISSVDVSIRAIGYVVHGFRGLAYVHGLFKWQPHRTSMSEIFYLKQYNHPMHHRNEDDKSYTLGDVLNASVK